jgi:CO/xanthine dehydrogenase FAD-binding subunit
MALRTDLPAWAASFGQDQRAKAPSRPQRAKAVAGLLLAGAKPTDDNRFKLKLVERTLGAVLADAKEAKA